MTSMYVCMYDVCNSIECMRLCTVAFFILSYADHILGLRWVGGLIDSLLLYGSMSLTWIAISPQV